MTNIIPFPGSAQPVEQRKGKAPIPTTWEQEHVALLNTLTGEVLEADAIADLVYRADPPRIDWDKHVATVTYTIAVVATLKIAFF